jgi:hypothetical protein
MTDNHDDENVDPAGGLKPPKAGRKLDKLAPSGKKGSKKKPHRSELRQVRLT